MIICKANEEILHKHRAKIKNFGKGVFYITNNRICFESNDKGLCFDLELKWLWNWTIKERKNKINLRWIEPKNQNDIWGRQIFDVDVEFDLNGDKLKSVKGVHYEIFYAKTALFPSGREKMGFWMDRDGETYNHYFCNDDNPEHFEGNFEVPKVAEMAAEEESYLKNATGETLLDQIIFERHTMRKAQLTESWRQKYPHIDDESLAYRTGEHPGSPEGGFRIRQDGPVFEQKEDLSWGDELKRMEAAGDTAGLKKHIPKPTVDFRYQENVVTSIHFQGGTIYDLVECRKKAMTVLKRVYEIMIPMRFETKNAMYGYRRKLDGILAAKFLKGEDISKYVPDFQPRKSLLPIARAEIQEYRKKLVVTN